LDMLSPTSLLDDPSTWQPVLGCPETRVNPLLRSVDGTRSRTELQLDDVCTQHCVSLNFHNPRVPGTERWASIGLAGRGAGRGLAGREVLGRGVPVRSPVGGLAGAGGGRWASNGDGAFREAGHLRWLSSGPPSWRCSRAVLLRRPPCPSARACVVARDPAQNPQFGYPGALRLGALYSAAALADMGNLRAIPSIRRCRWAGEITNPLPQRAWLPI
jgi:hypothetical protein